LTSEFKDHFSIASDDYDRYRPCYPEALFNYLASESKNLGRAWDCATGTGQSAVNLALYFREVIATDASEAQIKNTVATGGVAYKVALAESTDIEANSIDLITVAQALHWFNIGAFADEVIRVLKPDGMLAVWTYSFLNVNSAIDEIVNDFYGRVLEPYWPDERKMVEAGYKDIHFPLEEKQTPGFKMQQDWNLQQLIGYLSTWSAVKRYHKEMGKNPIEKLQQKLTPLWGQTENYKTIEWPLTVRLWVK